MFRTGCSNASYYKIKRVDRVHAVMRVFYTVGRGRAVIRYAVEEGEQAIALEFLQTFQSDPFGLDVLREFYRTLPEAREEALLKISVLEQKEQVYLLLLSTSNHHYFYLANNEEGLFLGDWEKGLSNSQILSFFDYQDEEAFAKQHPTLEAGREYIAQERTPPKM